MPDVWSTIANADLAIQERLAGVLDEVESDPVAQATLNSFLSELPFADSSVLEIGCGTGRVVRALAHIDGVAHVTGIDPSPIFIEKALAQTPAESSVRLEVMDGRELKFEAGSFDVVITYRTLMHIPGPERVLAECYRVLRPGGVLALLEADAAASTVAIGEHDPLQDCLDAALAAFLNDAWLVRRLPLLLKAAGFDLIGTSYYGDVRTSQPGVVLSQIDRGAETLVAWGRITSELAAALQAEARQRIESGRFYSFGGEVGFIARKVGS